MSFEMSYRARRYPIVLLWMLVALVGALGRNANATCVQAKPNGPWQGDYLTISGNALLTTSDLEAAVGYWEVCSTYSTGFPQFLVNASSEGNHVDVVFHGTHSGSGLCGLHTLLTDGNSLIEVWTQYFDSDGDTVNCGSPSWIIGHELGHALRLNDSGCCTYMMGGCNGLGSVQIDECIAVDGQWATTSETVDSEPDGPITDPDDPNGPATEDPATPIIIDIEGNGFRLSGIENAVRFDLDADGVKNAVGWTHSLSDDGFLVLDRNANGVIDGGRELFGASTPQPSAAEPNGFLALAVYDELAMGGNADSLITKEDAIYRQLRIWVDENHDGVSQHHELRTLLSVSIEGIRLDYFTAERRDQHGNLFRWASRILLLRGERLGAIDVVLVQDE